MGVVGEGREEAAGLKVGLKVNVLFLRFLCLREWGWVLIWVFIGTGLHLPALLVNPPYPPLPSHQDIE